MVSVPEKVIAEPLERLTLTPLKIGEIEKALTRVAHCELVSDGGRHETTGLISARLRESRCDKVRKLTKCRQCPVEY